MNISPALMFILSMLIFGTLGPIRQSLSFSSEFFALSRAFIGGVFLFAIFRMRKKNILEKLKMLSTKDILLLLFSSACIGCNWVLLFEAYQKTTVSVATLCYYMAPVFVIMAAPAVLHEKLHLRSIICVIIAFIGMIFVSGILSGSSNGYAGVFLGLAAAVLYACAILLNKQMNDIDSSIRTVFQLMCAVPILFIYVLCSNGFPSSSDFSAKSVTILLIAGLVHTGIAYLMYFKALEKLPAQRCALLSYADPAFAVLLSAFILHEPISVFEIIGAVMILGSAAIHDLTIKKSA